MSFAVLILGMEPKNQVIWTTRCKVMDKCIYFNIFQQKLDAFGIPQSTSHHSKKVFREGFALDYIWPRSHHPQNVFCFFQTMSFFGDLCFPSIILSPKIPCLSSKIVYQNLLYLPGRQVHCGRKGQKGGQD